MNSSIKIKNIIFKCGADSILPFALVFLFYIILHGHLSPGGGFQGGVLMVVAIALIYFGYGYEGVERALKPGFMHKAEGMAAIMYVVLALLGVAYAGSFCLNVFSGVGNIGELFSSGTIFWMNMAVGVKVLTGVGVLVLSILGYAAVQNRDGE